MSSSRVSESKYLPIAKCVHDMAESIRIRTDGNKAYRKDVIARASEIWECNQTDAVINSCIFSSRMVDNLERAKDHPDMTRELAEILSTPNVRVSIQTSLEVE